MSSKKASTSAETRKRKLETTNLKSSKVRKIDKSSLENLDNNIKFEPIWDDSQLLAEQHGLERSVSKNIVKLFEDGNTIPFIARYRKDVTGNMPPEILREVKEIYEEICSLKSKITTVAKTMEKLGQLNPYLKKSIVSARTIEELEHIYAPYKQGGKRTLAERAKELGLEEPAINLLNNIHKMDLNNLVISDKKELKSKADVEKGIIHIIAYVISTDTEMLSFLRDLKNKVNFTIETKKSASKQDSKSKKVTKNGKAVKPIDESKFENYFDFKIPTRHIKPHQVLAINRGESQKVLSVKIVVPDFVFSKFSNFCTDKWVRKGHFDKERIRILDDSIKDAYTRLIQPLIIREIRSELKLKADRASYEVFSTNLKHLLLAPPLKGKPILAIDPGYSNGCKLAVVSSTGVLLSYNVIFPHKSFDNKLKSKQILKSMLQEHNCSLIALGNGTACRETEEWLSNIIQNNAFGALDVKYTIVNEDGASIYSCSPEAKKEFPKLDPNIISSVSLARRIQDPLAELVKVEPQHLGVGMYQHDLKKKQLEQALDEVVSECVSFVGVDLNTASQCLLRRIAGLSDKRASQIIEYREKNGLFTHRKQLTDVKSIGARVFQQCAGFLRVGPLEAKQVKDFYKKSNTTKLDCTYIHPESYSLANKIITKLGLSHDNIGTVDFMNKVKQIKDSLESVVVDMSNEFKTSEESVKLILSSLCQPLNHDLRSDCSQAPLFKKGLTSICDIHVGTILTGRINNVTHFGCFVDIGVGTSGLIHSSKLNGLDLQIGDKVEVSVIQLDTDKKRISLKAMKKF